MPRASERMATIVPRVVVLGASTVLPEVVGTNCELPPVRATPTCNTVLGLAIN